MARKLQKRTSQTGQNVMVKEDCTALYIRVSTDSQVEEGFSLADQESRLRSYCEAQGWNVCPGHVYIDAGESGTSAARPEFQRMVQAAQGGAIRRIVAMKLDRLARNVRDFLNTVDHLEKWGCDLVLLKESFDTGTPHGRFALTMFAAIAELEASQITERVMAGKEEKAKQGGNNGRRTPLGYDFDNGEYTVNHSQAATVATIFELWTAGQSMTNIARRLQEEGHQTATGKSKWYPATVRYILTNGFYAGLCQWDGIEEEGDHPAIISRPTYERAISRLKVTRPGPVPG